MKQFYFEIKLNRTRFPREWAVQFKMTSAISLRTLSLSELALCGAWDRSGDTGCALILPPAIGKVSSTFYSTHSAFFVK